MFLYITGHDFNFDNAIPYEDISVSSFLEEQKIKRYGYSYGPGNIRDFVEDGKLNGRGIVIGFEFESAEDVIKFMMTFDGLSTLYHSYDEALDQSFIDGRKETP